MSSASMSLEHAATAIEKSVRSHIAAEVRRVIHEHVDPFIEQMAEMKARELCEDVRVHMERSMADPFGGMLVMVKFGGDK